MRWNCSVCVCLHVLLSINLLFRRVVLCTALRVDVDALMGMAEIPSNSFIHSTTHQCWPVPAGLTSTTVPRQRTMQLQPQGSRSRGHVTAPRPP